MLAQDERSRVDLRIGLHKLEVFEQVIECGGVSRAADRLFVAQPVVTTHVRSLEERLGVKLFIRDGRQMRLTEEGEIVHLWAAELLRRTRELERDLSGMSDGMQGSIALATSMSLGSYVLPSLLAAFRRERPNVAVKLNVVDYDAAVESVESGASDFAVVAADTDPSGRQTVAERIGEDTVVLIGPPGEKAIPGPVTAEILPTLPFIEVLRHTPFDRLLDRLGLADRQMVIEVGHPEAAKQVVKDGLGVSFLFRKAVAADIERGELCAIDLDGVGELFVPVYLVSRKSKVFSRAQRDLIGEIKDAMTLGATRASP
jgi:DNA-binding transcriptional LysR family regulator